MEIPIYIKENSGWTRLSEPITLGVPLPKGKLYHTEQLGVQNPHGQIFPLQAQPLSFWPDRSIRWMLVDFFADVPGFFAGSFLIKLLDTNSDCEKRDKIVVSEEGDDVIVSTGIAGFLVSTKEKFIRNILLSPGQQQGCEGVSVVLTDGDGKNMSVIFEEVSWENKGDYRRTVVHSGRVANQGGRDIQLKIRSTFYAGSATIKQEVTLHNPNAAIHPGGLWDLGDPGSFFFRDLSVRLHLAGKPLEVNWTTDVGRELVCEKAAAVLIHQNSSGGEQWDSVNHVDKDGLQTVSFKGYRVFGADKKTPCLEEQRAEPFVQALSPSCWVAAVAEDFWQNFPSAIKVQEEMLVLGLFPGEVDYPFELQGGEQKRHTFYLEFGLTESNSNIASLRKPLHAYVDPEWVEASRAIPYFTSQIIEEQNSEANQYINNIVSGENSFFAKREAVDEYGWRNFGDNYADHESVNHQDEGVFVSHYNNQYDFIYGALIQFLRSGDAKWRMLMSDAAKHMIDIDIYHTDDDKSAFNRGMFWHTDHYLPAQTATHRGYSAKNIESLDIPAAHYGGGPSSENDYSSGLMYYYFVTGDEAAREAVLELAHWVLDMDDGRKSIFSIFDEGPTGLASETREVLYHKAGRGGGNSINTLLDAYMLDGDRKYLLKAEELVVRCIHPQDDIDSLDLDDPENRWSYLVFLQILGKYINSKKELEEKDYFYHYARESLLHYAKWMAEHEVPYKEQLPKVDIPTETWSAHDIRKCHVFHIAALYSSGSERDLYRNKADFFYTRCLQDLLEYKTALFTRPLILIAVYNHVHIYFERNGYVPEEDVAHSYDFKAPTVFLPQKVRFKKTFSVKVFLLGRLLRLLLKGRLMNMQKLLRR